MQVMLPKKIKKVVLLGTGGTIAGTSANVEDNLGYTAAQLGVAQLLAAIPDLQSLPCEVVREQVAQLDSKDMGFAVWKSLANRVNHFLAQDDVQGVVITHGTDTLEETAFFLQLVLPALLLADKPVVLTCAMRPATSAETDGPQNLRDAIAVATEPGACGVVAVCAGKIHGAVEVQKVHPHRLDAFDSGDTGPIGRVGRNGLQLERNWPSAPVKYKKSDIKNIANVTQWPRVEIVMNHVGSGALMVEALLNHSHSAPAHGVRGIVVAATGNGSLHRDLESALLQAQKAGVRVVRSTRCAYGQVQSVPGNPIPDSQGLSPVKARIAMMLELMALSP